MTAADVGREVSLSLEPIPSDSVTMAEPLKLSTSMLETVLLSTSIVLLVRACEPDSVATVLSMANDTSLLEPVVSIPVPPVKVIVSLSRSIDNAPPLSAWKSKSEAVTCAST